MIYEVIIIGGGPAGLMAAVQLEKSKIKYLLVEKNERVGKKLLITGNKRCNVTNNLDVEDFVNALTIKHKRFLYSALYQFGPEQVIDFMAENGLKLILENNFKYFPETSKSQSVLDALMKNIDQRNIKLNAKVRRVKYDNNYTVDTLQGVFKAKRVIIATGSSSFPTTGSSGDGLRFAKYLNIEYSDFSPAETHVFSDEVTNEYQDLQGVAIENATVAIQNTKIKYRNDLLFTHFGLSGPVIYHLSEDIYSELNNDNNYLVINFTQYSKREIVKRIESSDEPRITKILSQFITKRHTANLINKLDIVKKNKQELSSIEIERIAAYLTEFRIKINEVEAKEKAYVNKGGILATELNPQTMETKKLPGLYFIGETTDLHGPIGGFNITIAFSTAYIAVEDIKKKVNK